MADWCGVMQGLMGCLGCANYSSLLLMRCISERNKVGNTLLYEATVLKYNRRFGNDIGWKRSIKKEGVFF